MAELLPAGQLVQDVFPTSQTMFLKVLLDVYFPTGHGTHSLLYVLTHPA